jgi:hypothetical protein
MGRFISRDPIKESSYYSFAKNCPLKYVDYDGRNPIIGHIGKHIVYEIVIHIGIKATEKAGDKLIWDSFDNKNNAYKCPCKRGQEADCYWRAQQMGFCKEFDHACMDKMQENIK